MKVGDRVIAVKNQDNVIKVGMLGTVYKDISSDMPGILWDNLTGCQELGDGTSSGYWTYSDRIKLLSQIQFNYLIL